MSAQNLETTHAITLFNNLFSHPKIDVEESTEIIGTYYQEVIFELIQDNVHINGNMEVLDKDNFAFGVQYIINGDLSFEYVRQDGKNTISAVSPEGTQYKTEELDGCVMLTLSNAKSGALTTLVHKPDFPIFLQNNE